MSENLNTITKDSIVNIHLQEENKQTIDLVQILNSLFIDKQICEYTKIISFHVSSTVITIVKRILEKSPQSLNQITVNIKDILEDGIIDHKDIPKFLLLVANLYKTEFSKLLTNIVFTAKDTVDFIKFLIKIIIEFNLVNVINKNNAFNMIDISGDLLELVLPDNKIKLSFTCCFPKK